MGFKTMTVADDAYEKAKHLKRPDESFTEWIRGMEPTRLRVRDLVGVLTKDEGEALAKHVKEYRAAANKGFAERMTRVRAGLKRVD